MKRRNQNAGINGTCGECRLYYISYILCKHVSAYTDEFSAQARYVLHLYGIFIS